MSWSIPSMMQGEYVSLQPLAIEHAPALAKAVEDGELWKLWFATVPSPDNMLAEIQRRLNLQEKGTMLPFTVIENQTQQPIGMTTYYNLDEKHKRVEIGWTWYQKNKQQTPVNTECKLLLTHAFEKLHCNVVGFRVNFFNQASRKAVERLGAKLDGILRNQRILKNGIISDDCAYSIVKSEWPGVKHNLLWKLQS
ncbi:MAG: GNAT family N-acetyltransferase [Legionellales bacterium]|nr:GNAT family N-acetyltransferase [Legionellales bacterium]